MGRGWSALPLVYVHRNFWCTYTTSGEDGDTLSSVRTPANIDRVPDKPKTQHRSVRIDDPEWDDGEKAAASDELHTDRSKVINQLYAWWLRRPGAKLPTRPSPELMAEIIERRQAHKND